LAERLSRARVDLVLMHDTRDIVKTFIVGSAA
jgi:hypothetical protein